MSTEIVIRKGTPLPARKFNDQSDLGRLRKAISRLAVATGGPNDWSFNWHDNRSPFLAAKQIGVTIKTRKMEAGGYKIWRVK